MSSDVSVADLADVAEGAVEGAVEDEDATRSYRAHREAARVRAESDRPHATEEEDRVAQNEGGPPRGGARTMEEECAPCAPRARCMDRER